MSNFEITCRGGTRIEYTRKQFAGGEEHVKLGKLPVGSYLGEVVVKGLVKSSSNFMELLLLADALYELESSIAETITADIGYMPYSRQDRVCNVGEAFSLRLFLQMLDISSYDTVMVDDLHSDVSVYSLELYATELVERTQGRILVEHLNGKVNGSTVLVSPDEGARGKAKGVGAVLGCPVAIAEKARCPLTGNITGTLIKNPEAVRGADCLIIDDICDGGRTFVPLIEELYDKGAKSVSMYVTHAILPYGIQHLIDKGLDKFYYYHIFREDLKSHPSIDSITQYQNLAWRIVQ